MKHLAAFSLLAAAAAPAAAVELVTNGGFEADAAGGTQQAWAGGWAGGDYTGITGWTITGGNAPSGVTLNWYYPDVTAAQTNNVTAQIWGPLNGYDNGLVGSPDGGAFMVLDGDAQFPGVISQVITGLTAGKKYNVSFSWAGAQQAYFYGPTFDKYVTVSLGEQSISTTARLGGEQGSFQPWISETFTFTAASGTETLKFLAHGMPTGMPPFVLLDGISMQSAVPEPATWAMMIIGFGLVGAVARRRAGLARAAA